MRFNRRIALPGNCAGLAIRGLRDGDVIVAVSHGIPFLQPPRPFEKLFVILGAARLSRSTVQFGKIRFEAITLLHQSGFILLLTGLAPYAQLRLVFMFIEEKYGGSESNKELKKSRNPEFGGRHRKIVCVNDCFSNRSV